jgi:hypothetical protein
MFSSSSSLFKIPQEITSNNALTEKISSIILLFDVTITARLKVGVMINYQIEFFIHPTKYTRLSSLQ